MPAETLKTVLCQFVRTERVQHDAEQLSGRFDDISCPIEQWQYRPCFIGSRIQIQGQYIPRRKSMCNTRGYEQGRGTARFRAQCNAHWLCDPDGELMRIMRMHVIVAGVPPKHADPRAKGGITDP